MRATGPEAGAAVRRSRCSGEAPAACGDDADQPLEREDRVALGALHGRIGRGERLDGPLEALVAPAGEVATSAVDLPGRQSERRRHLRAAAPDARDLAMKVRTMAKVSGVRGGGPQVASSLGLAPWQVDRARRDLAGWSDEGLQRAIEALAATDAAVKGAERDPVFALERLVGVISARGRA